MIVILIHYCLYWVFLYVRYYKDTGRPGMNKTWIPALAELQVYQTVNIKAFPHLNGFPLALPGQILWQTKWWHFMLMENLTVSKRTSRYMVAERLKYPIQLHILRLSWLGHSHLRWRESYVFFHLFPNILGKYFPEVRNYKGDTRIYWEKKQ